eukprot:CAMPEP_0183333172 /NCGR_PEP_ID=MMETSP0164_2-20130417/2126_1 /TAXON_ID=221442 /ORGANISM="Coccolithus pelagicus ssp braarudi, Strain PLY182g" /LENGTH=151 /DNA_ID=CAMNT_0025502025 /DNA_START=190 /DNA_END=645 /DNA_ORIENTATION=-
MCDTRASEADTRDTYGRDGPDASAATSSQPLQTTRVRPLRPRRAGLLLLDEHGRPSCCRAELSGRSSVARGLAHASPRTLMHLHGRSCVSTRPRPARVRGGHRLRGERRRTPSADTVGLGPSRVVDGTSGCPGALRPESVHGTRVRVKGEG